MPTVGWSLKYQHEYESALGRLLVRFNNLEILTGQVLEGALVRLEKPHLYRASEYFVQKVDKLELAMCALEDWPYQDFGRLRQINSWRNDLAHGDFSQDPITGEYMTKHVHRTGKKGKPETITPEEIDAFTDHTRDAHVQMGQLLPYIWFEDQPPDVLVQGARNIKP